MFVPSLLGIPIPLLPIHILWVNLITDGLPALALGVEPIERGIMQRQPRPKNEPVITKRGSFMILSQGAFITICTLAAFCLSLFWLKEDLGRARTLAFTTLTFSELLRSFAARSLTKPLFKIGVFTNMKLIYAAGSSFLLQMAVLYIPFLRVVFKVDPLRGADWLLIVLAASFPFCATELTKVVNKKRWKEI